MDDSDKALALRVLRDTLRDQDARPAERVSAAKLLLEHDARREAGPGSAHDATDDELLRIARGGSSPPLMGPAESRAAAVPSPSREALILGAIRAEQNTAPPNPFLVRTPGALLPEGPKTDPAKRKRGRPPSLGGAKRTKKESKKASQIKFDIDPLS